MPKSIKWRLQIWYGLILVAVLAGYGVTAYQLERGRQFRQLDEELHRRLNAVMPLLRRPPPGQEPDELRRPEQQGGRNGRGWEGDFHFTPPDVALFDAAEGHPYYFAIFARDGSVMAHSSNAPVEITDPRDVPAAQNRPPTESGEDPNRPSLGARTDWPPGDGWHREPPGPPVTVRRGTFLKIYVFTPTQETICAGRDIRPELGELRLTAASLAGIGGLILFVGLAGGWMFVRRTLRPVSEIGATARKISAGDLSQRINTAETESELGQLAAVLNSMFARLETAFAQQKQFASDAAHELRTPVSVMLTQTQTALGRERDAGGYRQAVEACQRAAQRMRRLIESLLELARFDAGQEVLKRLRFDLAKTADDCVELVRPLAAERGVSVAIESEAVEIEGDPERVGQVMTNLLTNAIQFNQPGGEVRVKLYRVEGLAILEVFNTGRGIAPEDLPHVFERFYRGDKSRSGAGNSGLGLAICKAVVEGHGGDVAISSTPNAGTKVTVRFVC